MELSFWKYQGTGNDFVMVDNRRKLLNYTPAILARLCDRKFGIGADGLIALEVNANNRLRMRYFNADGREGTMCGNGGRSFVRFVQNLGLLADDSIEFDAVDGVHRGYLTDDSVSIEMQNVWRIEEVNTQTFVDTGSPHVVVVCEDVHAMDVHARGLEIRHHADFEPIGGTNVNFVQKLSDDELRVRTFERGVEAETLSCGTGVVASALACCTNEKPGKNLMHIDTLGGKLQVEFERTANGFEKIVLTGPADEVFRGSIWIEI